jgi:hypothetical protein
MIMGMFETIGRREAEAIESDSTPGGRRVICPDATNAASRVRPQGLEQIEAATQARQKCSPVACSRCERETSGDERQISETQFQRAYCSACFDAVFIERRNFDMKLSAELQAVLKG